MRFFLGPRKNGKGSIGFGSPALLRVRAEPEAREGFLGENPRTPCSKRSTRPRCRCVPRRERRDPKPCLEGPARLQRQNTPARPRMSLTATAPSPASSPRAALERVRRRRHRRRARGRKGTSPPRRFPIGPSLPVDAPRSSPTVQPGGSDPSSKKKSRRSPTPRLAALVSLTPPPPNAQVVNNGFDAMWESRNKGKLFKDMTIPEPSEE